MGTSEDGRPLVDGRFRLIGRLGSGGMGTVWRARDVALDRDVALKEVRPPDPAVEAANPGFAAQLRERALREARALARLSHPHVVTVHHIVEPGDGAHPWIVMELVPGRSLHDRLAEGPMAPAEAIALGRQVLSALRAAHAAGIQHRDVKPANVLLREDGGAVLTDFGIAAFSEATSRLTSTGDVIGSAEFIAPERLRGEEGNPASDLWSLGMLLYVAAEGHHPLRRATSLATVVAVLDDPIPAPVRSGPLGPVLARVLVRDPAARPDGALLDRLLAEAEAGAAPAPTPVPPHAPAPAAAPVALPADEPAATPAPAGFGPPYAHPAHGTPAVPPAPAPAPSPWGAPTAPAGPPRTRGPVSAGRRAALVAGSALLTAALGAAAIKLLPGPGDGQEGSEGAKGGPSASTAPRTPGGTSGTPTTGTPAGAPGGSTAPAVRGSLLTPANVRAVVEAFRAATGTTSMKELNVYEEHASAEIPTRPGAKTYDRYSYRDGVVTKEGPGGTIDSPDEQPFDMAGLAWDALPALMSRGERDLKVENPSMRYVIADRWFGNDDRPSMRFYLINEYHATGYLLADQKGKVVKAFPAS
ncbi:serine/threonine-protein kinase [Streptomyces sp. NPDC014779]|uniref:serine/threonine-protein kinase n=1 Tax=Streptomyces sp. NPDC014779 TaxID=3364911 RepID=UPI0036FB1EF2